MTDKKISQLIGATTPLAGTEVLPIVQSGSTVKVSVADLTAGRTVDASTVNATTVDATNVEVTNVKAKDGTAAVTIADSTGAITVASGSTLNGGVVVNETGADVDFRVESDTNTHALFVDAGVSKVGIGTSTFNTNGGVLQVSNGISFPATQSACSDANTLDDYEEGMFAAVFTDSVIGEVGTVTCPYTKIGRVVTVNVYENGAFPSSSPSGTLTMTGLPFTSLNYPDFHATGVFIARKITGTATARLGPNSTTVSINSGSTETGINTADAMYTNGGTSERVGFSLTYIV